MNHPSNAFKEKVAALKLNFSGCVDAQSRFKVIMELGRQNPKLPMEAKTPANRVAGCQSTLHLSTSLLNDPGTLPPILHFSAESDALISNGLAYLLTSVYSGETAETVLRVPPDYLVELEIPASLSPSRANGLASLYLKMRQVALQSLVDGARPDTSATLKH